VIFSGRFWRQTCEQLLTVAAAAGLAGWTCSMPWPLVGTFAGWVSLYALLKCVASAPIGDKGSPMIVKEKHHGHQC
jgi:hypothetical protein